MRLNDGERRALELVLADYLVTLRAEMAVLDTTFSEVKDNYTTAADLLARCVWEGRSRSEHQRS